MPGPFWSWQRFGRTSTSLPDGRVIHIAGEHEDFYDRDFCIYNDVVVEYAGGDREFYLYPKDVFPPTDFHTATLIGSHIWLIGSLGYRDLRRHGETQVLRFDTRTLQFETLETAGDGPGWISRHTTERIGENALLVVGGNIQTSEGYTPNAHVFELDLTTLMWRRRPHGDEAVFPVSAADYHAFRSPRYGSGNPEVSLNPFWLAMTRRRWRPSRARLHYGSEVDAGKSTRTEKDVVWTAVREGALTVSLPNGRTLLIGGRILDYGDEGADAWIYNDIVVTAPNGDIHVATYPKDVFPHIVCPVGVVQGQHVVMFGIVDRGYHPDRTRGPAVLRLDTGSCAIEPIDAGEPPLRVNLYAGCETRDGERIVFPNVRQNAADLELGIPFDLSSLSWGQPVPYRHPCPLEE
ncbi:hypothetical protein [Hyphomicrobium sp.]|uniref:hypothetical protein n=1 Tax=Hyphomicrobium sp. TaxID=82 RepID=UPI0025C48F0A|nr:hypothetical protein [Hyphomicrobium sp.]MCC7251014.1 hypothetical protein [Hyphomicrobium sp.]